jgi:predicted N-acetyltransferase YhbS
MEDVMTQEGDDLDTTAGETANESAKSLRGTQVKFRIDEDQMRHVQRLAADHRTTVVATVRWLIDRGLESVNLRTLGDVAVDIELAWTRFGGRLMGLSLEQDLLQALEERRYDDARVYAIALRRQQAAEARGRVDKLGM